MSYTYEKSGDLVISGFDRGIGSSPYKGIGNMQGVNIVTESGEAMCSFARIKQSQVGTSGTLTQVNTNTVSITGITLKVGQVITITNAGTTGLSGNYYYLSAGKLYAGSLPPSDPDSAAAVTGISSGTATFSITYPLGSPIQSATEPYFDNTVQKYRYYILDNLGQIWCHDTATLANWDTPDWFFVGTVGVGASGLAVFNGWLTVANGYNIYWKLTSLLGSSFVNTQGVIGFESPTPHFMLNGAQNTLYGTDGYTITSLFPNAALVGAGVNIQTYASYSSSLGTNLVTNGTFTGSASGWTLGGAWVYNSNAVDKNADGTNTLYQTIAGLSQTIAYRVTFTISNWTVGSVTPSIDGNNGSAVSANGTYTQFIYPSTITNSRLTFTPTNTARFTIDSVSLVEITSVASIIGGSAPTTGTLSPRVPAIFFTDGTRPTAISADTIYYIQWYVTRFQVFAAASGGAALDIYTGAVGNQYFNAFDPTSTAGQTMLTFTPQALVLPFYETAQCMAELGNNVVIGTKSNVLYPWNQVDLTPGDLIFLPENNVVNIITVNNTGYVFCGYNGNIYITNGSSASPVLSVPDFCAGEAGIPFSYICPYLVWGGAMYLEGRVYFSILDQTATKTGNCGGIWSFTPTQSQFSNDDAGMALRVESQNSYGTYNGVANVLLADRVQLAIGPQYWTGWYSDISNPSYGIDYSDSIPQTLTIETDLIPTGTMLENRTFKQIEYKLSSPLVVGDTVNIYYRQNATDDYVTCGTAKVMSSTSLSGYFSINFEKGQWLQLLIVGTPLASSSSSFIRLREVRVR